MGKHETSSLLTFKLEFVTRVRAAMLAPLSPFGTMSTASLMSMLKSPPPATRYGSGCGS